jgi:hypothetical protein
MSIIFDTDLPKYIDEEDMNRECKYGSAIYLPKYGYAIEAFQDQTALDADDLDGNGFWSSSGSAASWVGNNASTIGNVAGAVGRIAELGINIARGAEEVKSIREMRERAKQAKPAEVAEMIINKPATTTIQPTQSARMQTPSTNVQSAQVPSTQVPSTQVSTNESKVSETNETKHSVLDASKPRPWYTFFKNRNKDEVAGQGFRIIE